MVTNKRLVQTSGVMRDMVGIS